ncbi:hypothetical protein WP1_075 [Pseudomonas phage WP1]
MPVRPIRASQAVTARPFDLKNVTHQAVAALGRIGLVFDHAVVH